MRFVMLLSRLALVVGVVAACRWLATELGPLPAVGAFAGLVVVLCSVTGLALARQEPGRVSLRNYAAGLLLPWGYKVGHGKLPAIVAVSAVIWIAIGVAAVLALNGTAALAAGGDAPLVARVLLWIAWLVDGFALTRLFQVLITRGSSVSRATRRFTFGLLGLVIASIVLVVSSASAGSTWLALALVGGPPLLIGGGYSLFLLTVLASGKKLRWN